MSKYTIESAICAISLALSCVMAGSGDLDCLRLFRSFRWRVDSDQTYGSHMVYGMAIGKKYTIYLPLSSINYGSFLFCMWNNIYLFIFVKM